MEHFQDDSDKAINPVASSCLVDEISSVPGSIFLRRQLFYMLRSLHFRIFLGTKTKTVLYVMN